MGHTFPAFFAGALTSSNWQMLQCYRSLTSDTSLFTTPTFQMIPPIFMGLNIVSSLMYPNTSTTQTGPGLLSCSCLSTCLQDIFTWISDQLHMLKTEHLISPASCRKISITELLLKTSTGTNLISAASTSQLDLLQDLLSLASLGSFQFEPLITTIFAQGSMVLDSI